MTGCGFLQAELPASEPPEEDPLAPPEDAPLAPPEVLAPPVADWEPPLPFLPPVAFEPPVPGTLLSAPPTFVGFVSLSESEHAVSECKG
jgi:hypothetical protein